MKASDFSDMFKFSDRLKLIVQNEIAECGLACIGMIANYHGHDFDMLSLRARFSSGDGRGLTFKDLILFASDLQLHTQAVKVDLENIHALRTPAILHWDLNHFVVFGGIKGKKYVIYDPAGSVRRYSVKEFSKHFTGVALQFSKRVDFSPAKARSKLRLSRIAGSVHGLTPSLVYLGFISLGILLISLISPYYALLMIDEGLASHDLSLINALFYAALVLCVLSAATNYMRSKVVLFVTSEFNQQSNLNLIRHLLHLPMSFFQVRHAGDILSRLDTMETLGHTLTEDLVISVIDGAIMVATFILLFMYSWQLTCLAFATTLLFGIVRVSIFNRDKSYQEDELAASAQEQVVLLESIRGMQSIKLYGIEPSRLNVWSKQFNKKLNASIKGHQLDINSQVVMDLIFGVETALILYIGTYLTLEGKISLGVLLAFIAKKDEFLSKVCSLVDRAVAFKMLDVQLDRLADIVLTEKEPVSVDRIDKELSGRIEISSLSYRYSANAPFILDNLDLTIDAGQSVAITGPSGSGKTTLIKLMLGLVEPHSGSVCVDGYNIRNVQKSYRKVVATVMQEDCILSGSIMDNICFFDDEPDHQWAMECAALACIHEDIIAMPMSYHSLVSDYNNTISGGQKQRILIARAFYQKPKILFMDEATSNLDTANEALINKAIKAMGVTRIIIAHRPETIQSADRIFDLVGGKLMERSKDGSDDGYEGDNAGYDLSS